MNFSKNNIEDDYKKYNYLYNIPPKIGRYIVLDTETTGLGKNDHVIEIGANEIKNGRLTGVQFHIYLKSRKIMNEKLISIHKIKNDDYDKYYKNVYADQKTTLENFLNFIGDSIIFAHNASFDLEMINKELRYWKLKTISPKKFRCTMRIFQNVISKVNEGFYLNFSSLKHCCNYFNLENNENQFHNALFDSYMTARLINKIYDLLDMNKHIKKDKNLNLTNSLDNFLINKKEEKKNYLENKNVNNIKKRKFSDLKNFDDKENLSQKKIKEIIKVKENMLINKFLYLNEIKSDKKNKKKNKEIDIENINFNFKNNSPIKKISQISEENDISIKEKNIENKIEIKDEFNFNNLEFNENFIIKNKSN